jgi:hypothetical protein
MVILDVARKRWEILLSSARALYTQGLASSLPSLSGWNITTGLLQLARVYSCATRLFARALLEIFSEVSQETGFLVMDKIQGTEICLATVK